MFTQSGSLVAYSKIPDKQGNEPLENPMLSFTLDVLKEIKFFN